MSGTKPRGMHREKRLTAATVRALSKPGLHADGNGLYLKVDASGAKRWIQRLMIQGKRRDIGLGPISLISLSEARERAIEHRRQARAGSDPIGSRQRSEAILTFKQAAAKVYEIECPNWRNLKHGKQWLSSLDKYAFPTIGAKRVDTITSGDVMAALTPIWNTRPETARRVKQRINRIMDWVIAQGWRIDNPATVTSRGLSKHDRSKVQHRRALPYSEVAGAIKRIRDSGAGLATKLAFEFLIHTATRSAEVREAVWSEINMDDAEWIIPASRMKAKRIHRVPLSDRAIAILREAEALRRDDDDLVFPGTKATKPLSDITLSKLIKELGIAAVPHGFRSSFRDWAGEATPHPREVIEFALAHTIRDKAEAAYARSDLLKKRRTLMAEWSAYLI